jgi:hypothetical protein
MNSKEFIMPIQDSDNPAYWKQLIHQQIKSGLPASKFCMVNNLKTHQFSYYKSVLFPSKAKKALAFVKVLETKKSDKIEPARIILYFKDLSLSFEGNYDLQSITDLCVLLSAQK